MKKWSAMFQTASLRGVVPSEAIRGGIVSAVPAIAAVLLSDPQLCWSAIAAFWTCFGDPGGSRNKRLAFGLAFGWIAAIGSAVASWTGNWPITALGLAAFAGFAGGLANIYGSNVGRYATLAITAFTISLVSPVSDISAAVSHGLYFLYGNLWALAFGVVFWPVDPTSATRRSLQHCWEDLATVARQLAKQLVGLDPVRNMTGSWRTGIRRHLENVRVAMSPAAKMRMGKARLIFAQQKGQLDSLEQVLAGLAALDDLVARWTRLSSRQDWRTACLSVCLEQLAYLFENLTLDNGPNQIEPRHQRALQVQRYRLSIDRFEQACQLDQVSHELHAEAVAIVVVLRNVGDAAGKSVRYEALEMPNDTPPRLHEAGNVVWKVLARAVTHLTFESAWFFHALRLGLVCVISVCLVQHLHPAYGYWLILTALFLTQPKLAMTLTYSVQRVAGTLLGVVLAVVIGELVHSPLLLGIAVLPLAVGTLAGRSVSYWTYTLFLTSHFVIVAQLGQPHVPEFGLAYARLLNSAAGAAIAVAVSMLIRPRIEGHRLAIAMADAMRADAAYLAAAIRVASGEEASSVDLPTLRRTACVAIDAVEESTREMLIEPNAELRQAAIARRVVAALRRATSAGAMLEVFTSMGSKTVSHAQLQVFAEFVEVEMSHCAQIVQNVSTDIGIHAAPYSLMREPSLSPPLQRAVQRIAEEIEAVRSRVKRSASPKQPNAIVP